MRAVKRGESLCVTIYTLAVVFLFLGLAGPQPSLAQETDMSVEAVLQAETRTTAGGSVRPPANAVTNAPASPGITRDRDASFGAGAPVEALGTRGGNSDTTLWGEIRHGETVTTQAPGPTTNFLVQDGGMAWEQLRSEDGALRKYGTMALFSIFALLFIFYLFRGRVEIEHGRCGDLIERFKPVERFGHWLLAGSFILLALSGLNLLYGRELLIPIMGKEMFATVTMAGKWVHNNVAWGFMLGLVIVFLMWVWHNFPSVVDLKWIAQGGGLLSASKHPPAKKFNAGQKVIFWGTILMGASISLSGISLLFPYELPLFAKTFAILNSLGVEAVWGSPLPETLTPLQEMQYAQLWHTIVAFAMIFMILAHIYIGSMGMEGAFDAMGTGMVDRNWAEEHHSLWVKDYDAKHGGSSGTKTPAE